VTSAFLLGHVFSYALVFGANQILDPGGFGLLYATLLAITVLHSPTTAFTFVLGRRIASENAVGGREEAVRIGWLAVVYCVKYGTPLALLVGVVLAVVGSRLGIEAWQILFLLPATVLTLVVAEVIRVSFQSLLLFIRASMLWLTSQGAQVVLSLVLLALSGRVWAGVLGVLLGAALASAAFAGLFATIPRGQRVRLDASTMRNVPGAIPLVLAYSLFILMNSLDMLVGYWLLPRPQLGAYAASALLPKAVVTATFAVSQVLVPVIVEQKMDGLAVGVSVFKAIAMAAGMSMAAAAFLWLTTPFLQATPLAIRGLDFTVMMTLAAAAVALSALRVIIVVEGAMQRYAIGLAQSIPIVLFIALAANGEASADHMATLYTTVVWVFLIGTAAIFLLLRSGLFGPIRSQDP